MSTRLAVITRDESNVLSLLKHCTGISVAVFDPQSLTDGCLDAFDCACILGGTRKEPLVLCAKSRTLVEEFAAAGKKVLFEYTSSFCENYCKAPESTRFLRLVCADSQLAALPEGTLLDDQCNLRIAPYYHCRTAKPILVYKKGLSAHACQTLCAEDRADFTQYGIWFETPRTAVCSFCLSNFINARFSPVSAWRKLIASLFSWLCDIPLFSSLPFWDYYRCSQAASLRETADAAIGWFERAGMLIEDGAEGIREGMATEILPNGHQKTADPIRTDCAGEAAMAYFFHYLVSHDPKSLRRASLLEAFVYERMQIRSGRFAGMLRWTNIAWTVCYPDDMARAMFVTLFKALYNKGREYLPQCRKALGFLMDTTGPDGLRAARTDILNMTQDEYRALSEQDGAFPCAHYNAFYLACLLIYGKMERDERCLAVGEQGMRSLLKAYPQTIREQSETEELCRLLLPLSWLYYATGKEEDRTMLYTVVQDLEKMLDASGAYLEWDSDYSAACSKQNDGECSLLGCNGDPVVDLLYSNNWVPLGMMQAYFVTGDPELYKKFERHARFLSRAQLHSDDPQIDGAWARGFDTRLMEVYGIPNDVGWGPWAIESGWTVAEIIAGLYSGVLKDELKGFYT